MWLPREESLGTTNQFIISASYADTPSLRSTNAVEIRVANPPPIVLELSNSVPVLHLAQLNWFFAVFSGIRNG
jgi:hypothetical protein